MKEFFLMWGILVSSLIGAIIVLILLLALVNLVTEKFGEIGFLSVMFVIITGVVAWILTGD